MSETAREAYAATVDLAKCPIYGCGDGDFESVAHLGWHLRMRHFNTSDRKPPHECRVEIERDMPCPFLYTNQAEGLRHLELEHGLVPFTTPDSIIPLFDPVLRSVSRLVSLL